MARKSAALLNPLVTDAIETFEMVSELKGELADATLALQDKETRRVIEGIANTLATYTTGNLVVEPPKGKPIEVKVDATYLTMNLRWLAVEIAKSLALLDVRLANFVFPESLCTNCGAEIIPERKGKKVPR